MWDASIVAATQGSGATIVLTEDLQHGQVSDGLRVGGPVAEMPEGVLA